MIHRPAQRILPWLLLLAVAGAANPAQAQAVLQVEGIKGSVSIAGYEGAVPVQTFQFGQSRTRDGQIQIGEVTLSRAYDPASPELLGDTFINTPYGRWTLTVLETGAKALQPVVTLDLCDALVTAHSTSGGSDGLPFESVSFAHRGYRLGIPRVGKDGAPTGDFDYTVSGATDCTYNSGPPPPTDSDGDGILDARDNCPAVRNAGQANFDGDAQGDACDADDDNDGFADVEDAFPLDATEWVDTDGDGIGNNADLDDDNDGLPDTLEIEEGLDPLDGYCPPRFCGSGVLKVLPEILRQRQR